MGVQAGVQKLDAGMEAVARVSAGHFEDLIVTYYRLDTSKLTIRECFRLGGGLAPFLLILKVLRVNLADQEVCACDIEDLVMLEQGQIESRCAEAPKIDALRSELSQSGGTFLFGYTIPPHLDKLFSLVYLMSDECLVEVIHSNAEKPHTMVVAITPMEPHGEKITVLFPAKKGMDSDPLDDVQKLDSGTIEELLEFHLTRPSKSSLRIAPVNHEEALTYIVRRVQRAVQRFVRRGVYIPLPPDEEY